MGIWVYSIVVESVGGTCDRRSVTGARARERGLAAVYRAAGLSVISYTAPIMARHMSSSGTGKCGGTSWCNKHDHHSGKLSVVTPRSILQSYVSDLHPQGSSGG